MEVVKYIDKYREELTGFLRLEYLTHGDCSSWLPARFEDLVYRIEVLKVVERKEESLLERCWVCLCDGRVVGAALWDGCYYLMAEGPRLEVYSALADKAGKVVAIPNSNWTLRSVFQKRMLYCGGSFEYMNKIDLMVSDVRPRVPIGFWYATGVEKTSIEKQFAMEQGFHPELREPTGEIASYRNRENAPLFHSSKERLMLAGDGTIAGYVFCYVDDRLNCAYIEPVCVREQYMRKGVGKAMIQCLLVELKRDGVETCWVNAYEAWRKDFYASCGFIAVDYYEYWTLKG